MDDDGSVWTALQLERIDAEVGVASDDIILREHVHLAAVDAAKARSGAIKK